MPFPFCYALLKTQMIIVLLIILPWIVQAQSVRLSRTEQQGSNVLIWYDLEGTNEDQLFNVEIYASHNNYSRPLSHTSGDVGPNISPGTDKKIIWNVRDELTDFKGIVGFRIEANVQLSSFYNLHVSELLRLKRGRNYSVTWEGGEERDSLDLELFRNGEKIYKISNLKNTGSYDWTIPQKLKPGNRYYFVLTNIYDITRGAESDQFKIKRRTPLSLISVPAVIVTGIIIYIITKPQDPEQLPEPPGNPDTW